MMSHGRLVAHGQLWQDITWLHFPQEINMTFPGHHFIFEEKDYTRWKNDFLA